jgi:hypothetical protein
MGGSRLEQLIDSLHSTTHKDATAHCIATTLRTSLDRPPAGVGTATLDALLNIYAMDSWPQDQQRHKVRASVTFCRSLLS